MRPPWASTIAREIARPRPAPSRARRLGAAAEEGLEDARAVLGGDPVAGVGDLDLDRRRGLGAHGDAAVGRRVADRVLDQVEQHALELLGVGARRRRRPAGARPHGPTPLRRRPRAHRLDRLPDELVQRHLLHRPAMSPASRRESSKRSSISALSARDVGAHARRVVAASSGVDDVVADRVGEQSQRRDRGAQVV